MKIAKILLGAIFVVGAIGSYILGIRFMRGDLAFSAKGVSELAALVAAVNLLALFSAWSFKGAFRGKLPPQDKSHEGNTANAEDGEGDSTDSQKNR